jgi:hypothetical protein
VGGSEGKRKRRRLEGKMGRGVGGKNGYERGKGEGEWELRKGRLIENRMEAGAKEG